MDSLADPLGDIIQRNGFCYLKHELNGLVIGQGLFVFHFMRGL